MKRIGLGWLVVCLGASAALGCGAEKKNDGDTDEAGKSAGTAGSESVGGAGATDSGGSTSNEAGASDTPGDGGTAGAAGAGGTNPALDPCGGVTVQGECVTPSQARACVVPTGNGTPMLVTTNCRKFEHCDTSKGQARCVLDDDACVPGQAECLDDADLRVCSQNGVWQTQACAGSCRQSALGGFCVETQAEGTFQGTLQYEGIGASKDYSDWSDSSVSLPAEGVLVLAGDGTDWLDAALVDEDGNFTIQVPTTNTGNEQLAFFLLHPDPTGAFAQFGVFDADVPDGVVSTDAQWDGQVWSWSAALSDFESGATIGISEAQGSGAIHIYNRLLQIQRSTSEFYGKAPGTIAAWMHLNTAWDCGACFAPWGTEVASMPFDSQLFISATAEDRAYWSDAVTAHEAGHYTMWSYGFAPNEGGQHCLGLPTAPGQAWSEGWATGFSSILRGSSVYYDKQQGSMFWFDLAARQYDQAEWQRPRANAGLLQQIDENEVAAMIWALSEDPQVGAENALAGLVTPSVTEPDFKRGYTRHVWDMDECRRIGYYDTGESSPMFADYLDGLVCGGIPAAAIDRVTSPKQYFPYPSSKPLCP
jgi:hypothetical protein